MTYTRTNALKKYPFVRLLLPFVAGIILQWHLQLSLIIILLAAVVVIAALVAILFFPFAKKYTLRWLEGVTIILIFFNLGALVVYIKDIRHQAGWFENYYKPGNDILITLEEPLVEKNNSFKALATVNAVKQDSTWKETKGKILVYLKKENSLQQLDYGSQLLLHKPLQQISNNGNPGAFDYRRYCLFEGITGQIFVSESDYRVLTEKNTNVVQQKLYDIRDGTLQALQKYIPGKREQGVAEALLIGYREDLDKDITQAYSNTGVVHIIAISGLHLAMIYYLLNLIFSVFKRYKYRWIKIVKPLIILFVLWTFTLIAGAVPSILRSAVMFSFIVAGESLGRRTNIYNTLAASSFCMLVFNPFLLWAVGFLLSYAAVIGIVAFMRPVYKWLYFRNKLLDYTWKQVAVTISAQIFTLPIIIFYFHQFPNLFLITNLIVVPLSGIVLYGEILLLAISPIGIIAKWTGILLGWLLWFLNTFIVNASNLPFAVFQDIRINVTETLLLNGFVIAVCLWLMRKSSKAFITSLVFLAFATLLLSFDIVNRNRQQRVIVYNVPNRSAIDIMQGDHYRFIGDSVLLQDGFLRNFHLKPSRIYYHCPKLSNSYINSFNNKILHINGTTLLILDNTFSRQTPEDKIPVDIIVLSKNPPISVAELQNTFSFKQLVIDSSNPLWKTERWKKDCDSLHLRFHSVTQQGAFVTNL